jgi:tagatose 1,6-diphosphate aldolase GatY/KbaY
VRARFVDLLADAAAQRSAVGGFTCYNFETALGVLDAAEASGAGVILLVSKGSFVGRGGRLLTAGLVELAERSAARACVQLDHVSDLAAIEAALELGVSAVMADGSTLPLDDNVELVRAASRVAGPRAADVEAELGRIEGDEDVAAAAEGGALTDPDEAADFVSRTAVSCLAVSIGNVHGTYREPPRMDWTRLAAIRSAVDVPLSLHGASGLPDRDVREAVALGVAKVNVNTELREAYLTATAERLGPAREGWNVLDVNRAQADAIAEAVMQKLTLLEPEDDRSLRRPRGGVPSGRSRPG